VVRKRAATRAKRDRDRARELGGGDDDDPDDKAQMNFTDPESRIMEAGGSFIQGYNCQAAGEIDRPEGAGECSLGL